MQYEALKHYAEIFFSKTVIDQDVWAKDTLNVTSRTFRRWCKAANITVKKIGNHVEITQGQ